MQRILPAKAADGIALLVGPNLASLLRDLDYSCRAAQH